jgi:hypothetical protein
MLYPSEINGKAQIGNKYNNDRENKIAFVAPTFTAAAYDSSFYRFYAAYKDVRRGVNITTDVNLLTSKVRDQPFTEIKSKYVGLGSIISVITDQDVHEWFIFTRHISVENNNMGWISSEDHNVYDVLLLGHQEYVRQQEYTNLKHFVANGGTLIILDGNVLLLLKDGIIRFSKQYHLVLISKGNECKESSWEDEQVAKYNTPLPFANGLIIGIITVKPSI